MNRRVRRPCILQSVAARAAVARDVRVRPCYPTARVAAILVLVIAGTALLTVPRPAWAQVFAGIGVAQPAGGFSGARPGWFATVGRRAEFHPVSLRLEATYSRIVGYLYGLADAPRQAFQRVAAGVTLAFHPRRFGTTRPYVLAGASFGRRVVGGGPSPWEASWEPGYHVGVGWEIPADRVVPYAEARFLHTDTPRFTWGKSSEEMFAVAMGLRLR